MTNTEPQGIKDIREAKANYLDALAELRKADAAVRNADAEYRKAETELKQAEAAVVEAAARAAEIAVELEDAAVQAKIAEIKAQAEIDAVKAKENLAKAQAALDSTLRNLAATSLELTGEEQNVINRYTAAYISYIDKQEKVREAEENLYDAMYNKNGENTVEAAKAEQEIEIAIQTANIERAQAKYDEYSEMAEEEIAKYDVWAAEVKALEDSAYSYKYVLADIEKAEKLAELEYADAFGAFFKELEKAQSDVDKKVSAANATFKLDKTYTLPTTGQSVVNTFASAVNNAGFSPAASFEVVDGSKLVANATDPEATAKNIFGDEKNPDNASLAGIIDALKRDSVVVDKIINDTTGLSVAVAKLNKEYKDVLAALKKGVMDYPKVKESVDAYKKAVEDSTKAKKNLDTAIENLQSTWTDLCKVYINTNLGADSNTDLIAKQYYVAFQKAIEAFAKARTAYFGEAAIAKNSKSSLDCIRIFKGYAPDMTPQYDTTLIASLTSDDFNPVKKGDNYVTYLDIDNEQSNSLMARMHAYNVVLSTLMPYVAVNGDWYTKDKDYTPAEDTVFKKIMFSAPVFDEEGEISGWDAYLYNKGAKNYYKYDYASERTSTSETFTPADLVDTYAAQIEAKQAYYENVYKKFWGLSFDVKVSTSKWNADKVCFKDPKDSLVINFSEKTYTDPYVIPVFTANDPALPIFIPAKGKTPADFVWGNIKYNENDSELKLIEQSRGNNIKKDTYTLYAKSLAAAQISSMVEDYKENTKALAALEVVVAKVEADYLAALLNLAEAKVVADSVVTAYLGEDIVKAKLAGTKKTATDIWNDPTEKAKLVVDCVTPNFDSDKFVTDAGKYNLGGKQLAAAEKHIPDYAAFVAKNRATKAEIKAAQDGCAALAEIVNDYAKEIAKLDKNFHWGDSETIDAFVRAKWALLLASIEQEIEEAEKAKAAAEGALARLEAGYGVDQTKIETAKNKLEEAQAALEAAEVELTAAEAAYQQVLANHGLAE